MYMYVRLFCDGFALALVISWDGMGLGGESKGEMVMEEKSIYHNQHFHALHSAEGG